jgi:parallel beta-helix repeat protein
MSLKKQVSTFLIVLSLSFAFSFVRCVSSSDDAKIIIHVHDYASIQQAIDNATVGATILVDPGTYHEHVNIDKSISLVGEDRETTIIDGLDSQNVISITSEGVTIESLTITKSTVHPYDSGIGGVSVRGIVVDNTKIVSTNYGIDMAYCANSLFSGNIVTNQTNAVILLGSNNNVFSNNVISGNLEGISLFISSNNGFVGNTLSNNEEGIAIFSPSNRNYFYHNNIEDTILLSGGTANIWNRGGEGNYWSSYNFTGQDVNRTGIGNDPFVLDESNQDNDPLMGAFTGFDVASGNETYHINVISNSTISDFRFGTGRETGNKMLTFNAEGQNDTSGFCRMMIPTSLMNYPYTVVANEGEVASSLLAISNTTNAYLYFTYPAGNQSITVVSPKEMQVYNELLDKYIKLQADLDSLNASYQGLLVNYNTTLQTLFNSLNMLLGNLTQLQNSFSALNSSLQNNLKDQSDSMQNMRNITYILAATTAAFLITTAYLSARVHATKKQKNPVPDER